MVRIIKTISDGSRIEYDKGKFDEWCVYIQRPNALRYAPTDAEYFTRLSELGETYGYQKIYNDYLEIYAKTDSLIRPEVIILISSLAASYLNHTMEMDLWFTVIYAGMVAGKNKKFAKLKKRIKRLGMHQILMDKKPPIFAARFSKGKEWKELDAIMRQKGF